MTGRAKNTAWAAAALAALLAGCAELETQWQAEQVPGSDAAIASEAMTRLKDDPMLGRSTFSVEVRNGVATVRGSVAQNAERVRALQIVEDVSGVSDVKDMIRRR